MKVSVILPVFNEEKRVGKLARALSDVDFVFETIFVDDGSQDKSYFVLKKFESEKLKIFRLKENKGKGFALGYGIEKSRGEILVFLDSDLEGLREIHLRKLILPLIKERKKCVVGVPLEKKRKLIRPWEIYLSGERAYFKKDLISHLPTFFKLRYGIELFLDSLFEPKDIKIVRLFGLISPSKFKKKDFGQAILDYFKETKEIFEDLSKIGFSLSLAQNLIKCYIREMMGVWLSGRAHP